MHHQTLGYLAKKLKAEISCADCVSKISSDTPINPTHSLISKKDRGSLHYPSMDLLKLCKIIEKFILYAEKTEIWMKPNILSLLSAKIIQHCIEQETNLFSSFKHDHGHFYNHVKLIVITYGTIRLKHIVKLKNQQLKTGKRVKLSKQILFENQ